ncbi:fibronectin type III domain-containing protein [Frigoriflavimonas asaccharolytica]|uniref:Fibronectin type-III domain-containing protein n=1 Tax=Frigoriflavimonas asaccharolytica TaxID=2735899 RepID=A0A8J8K8I1_9FLAO|nr:fibronectin type III domain-containing protein [Frigoriflavimonas asaccharolytica]NRS93003.1 hypothetical protein [Frigoriflavimonas asaccharolytica]
MKKLLLLCMLILGIGASAQIVVNEGFENTVTPTGFVYSSISRTTTATRVCTGTAAVGVNLWSLTTTANLVYSSTASNATAVTVSFNYSTQEYFSGDGVGLLAKVEYSVNGGTSYTQLGSDIVLTGNKPCTQFLETIPTGAVPLNANFKFRITGNHTSGDFYFNVDDLKLQQVVSCSAPLSASASAVTITSAAVNWVAPATVPALGYDVYYNTTNVAPISTTIPNLNVPTGNSTTVSGLMPATTYYGFVRSRCSAADQSNWIATNVFVTPCTIFSAPFSESFSSGALPNCWTNLNPTTTSTSLNVFWKFGTGVDYGAAGNGRTAGTYAWVDASSPYANEKSVELTTPSIDLTGLTAPFVQFDWFKVNATDNAGTTPSTYDNNSLTVAVNDGTGWVDIFTSMSNATSWRTEGIALAGSYVNKTIQVRFTVNKNTGTNPYFYDDLLLDEVKVINAPSCIQPSAIAASSITPTSANLMWTAPTPAPASGYDVYYSTVSTAPTAATVPTNAGVTATTVAVSNLTPSTQYFVWVRAKCDASTNSDWASGGNFTTATFCPVITVPANNAASVSTTPTITWTAVSGATGYRITMGTTANGTNILNNVDLGNVTTYTLATVLSNSTQYFYRINAYSPTITTSLNCTERNFTTACAPITPTTYTNDFATIPGTCWERAGDGTIATGPTSTGTLWRALGFLQGTGSGSAAINLYTTGRIGWLISPTFNLAGGGFTMSFKYGVTEYNGSTASAMGSDDAIDVLMSTDGGTTWASIKKYTAADNVSNTSNLFTYPITSTSNQVKFAFLGTDGTVDDAEDFEFYVDDFQITNVLATSETLASASNLTISPNPFKDFVRISDVKDVVSISIVDMAGRMVKTVKPASEINLSSLNSGIYLINLKMKDGSVKTVKAIKK